MFHLCLVLFTFVTGIDWLILLNLLHSLLGYSFVVHFHWSMFLLLLDRLSFAQDIKFSTVCCISCAVKLSIVMGLNTTLLCNC